MKLFRKQPAETPKPEDRASELLHDIRRTKNDLDRKVAELQQLNRILKGNHA